MIFTVKERGKKQTFEGFGTYRNRTEHILITYFCGEIELFDWDGTELGVEELKRYYRSTYSINDNDFVIRKYTKIGIV